MDRHCAKGNRQATVLFKGLRLHSGLEIVEFERYFCAAKPDERI
jgi:hypothetical protein